VHAAGTVVAEPSGPKCRRSDAPEIVLKALLVTDNVPYYRGLEKRFQHFAVNHSAGEYVSTISRIKGNQGLGDRP
jgi:hypothetical protein